MNETQRAEHPVAELIRGLMRDRSFFVEMREKHLQADNQNDVDSITDQITDIDSMVQNAIKAHHDHIIKNIRLGSGYWTNEDEQTIKNRSNPEESK